LPITQHMRIPWSRNTVSALLLVTFFLGQPLTGAGLAAETCDKLYADYLEKAKQALRDKKPDDAVAFLLKASTVAQGCANSEKPEGQGEQKTLALVRLDSSFSDSAL
jgi:hypothetical protein